jgi:hypothetical protein
MIHACRVPEEKSLDPGRDGSPQVEDYEDVSKQASWSDLKPA